MSQPQHMTALARATEVRLARCALERDISARKVMACEVLLSDIPDYLGRMHVERLLDAVPRLHRRKVLTVIAAAKAGPACMVETLTIRQRQVIAERLVEWECAAVERAERRRAA